MKQAFFVFALTCVFLGAGIAVSAQDAVSRNDARELKFVYAELDRASRELNVKVFEKYFSENYQMETSEEILDKRQMLDNLKNQFAMMREVTETFSVIENIEAVGESFVVEVKTFSVGKILAPGGKIRTFSVVMKSTDVWRKNEKGIWQTEAQIDRGNTVEVDRKSLGLA